MSLGLSLVHQLKNSIFKGINYIGTRFEKSYVFFIEIIQLPAPILMKGEESEVSIPPSNSLTPAECPMIQLSSDTNYPDSVRSRRLRAQSHKEWPLTRTHQMPILIQMVTCASAQPVTD